MPSDPLGRAQTAGVGDIGGAYIGNVTQVNWGAMTCRAKIVGLHAGFEYRDIVICEGPWVQNHRNQPKALPAGGTHYQWQGGDGSHSHAPHRHNTGSALKPGDTIVVIPVHGFRDRFIMIGRTHVA